MVKEVPATSSSAARSPKAELFAPSASNCFFLSLLLSPPHVLLSFEAVIFLTSRIAWAVQIYTENSNWLAPAKSKSSKIADPNTKYERVEE